MKQSVFLLWLCVLVFSIPAQADTGVVRSIITTSISNKEPVSDLQQVSSDTTRVYYFTDVRGLNGHAITHRWEYNGKLMAEITFSIEADRWRTWSSKNMLASWTGNWQVSVLDEGGNIMEQKEFEYVTQAETEEIPVKTEAVDEQQN